jgi:hypothetical protein
LRDKIASLFENLADINSQIRNQLENGEPKPITQPNYDPSGASFVPENVEALISPPPQPVVAPSPVNLEQTYSNQPKEKPIANTSGNRIPAKQNWPGRYTLLANKDSLDLTAKAKVTRHPE